jgi:type IV pilus assembly protein PilX
MRNLLMNSSVSQQKGAVLIVSLILLLVMTILAVSGSQLVKLQERMSGNIRDADIAFQSAEASLRDTEEYVELLASWPTACTTVGAGCNMYETGALVSQNLSTTNDTFWTTYGREYRTASTKDITEAYSDPRSLVERLGSVCDTAEGACPESEALFYFRVTARAQGGTQTADARLESTYVRHGT